MNYSRIVEELQNASPFELYRLKIAISRLLENPEKIEEIRNQLKPGQRITYFDWSENREIAARIIKLKQTRLLVENEGDKQLWNIPFYYVNLAKIDTQIRISSSIFGLDKNQLRIGDRVGFVDQQNNDLYGKVIRLNQKTVTIVLEDKTKWRVPYRLLFLVIEGDRKDAGIIEGEVLKRK